MIHQDAQPDSRPTAHQTVKGGGSEESRKNRGYPTQPRPLGWCRSTDHLPAGCGWSEAEEQEHLNQRRSVCCEWRRPAPGSNWDDISPECAG